MKSIPLTQGKFAVVDDADFELVSKYRWHLHKAGKSEYARTVTRSKNKLTRIYMHRLILNAPKPELVDHRDGGGLNNQRSNLRVCNPSQNIAGKRMSKNNTSGFKGVFYSKIEKKFFAVISPNKKFQTVGRFENAIDAAIAYDAAATKHFGNFARTNASLGLL